MLAALPMAALRRWCLKKMNMTTDDRSGLEMSLPALAGNVAVVRHALAGLAEEIGMDEAGIADLKTVVTEACMNVVVHAYPADQPGLLEVKAVPGLDGLTVAVRDYGMGIRPRPDVERPSLRIGLTLIAALSTSFEIKGGAARGTEITMEVPLTANEVGDEPEPSPPAAAEMTRMRVGSPELVAPVLSRALAALAARHQITVDRISDAILLSDAISAGAPNVFEDGQVRLSIADRSEGVELRIGPMESGGADRLRGCLKLPELGGSIEVLADELRIEQDDDGDFLIVGIASLSA